jgi:hypothetical protein
MNWILRELIFFLLEISCFDTGQRGLKLVFPVDPLYKVASMCCFFFQIHLLL